MNKLSLLLISLTPCLMSGCIGLSIGGTTQTPAPAVAMAEKAPPSAKDYGLSDEAAAAFLNDKEVIDAYRQLDMQHGNQSSFMYKEAIRTLDRKAASYKAKYPAPVPVKAAQ